MNYKFNCDSIATFDNYFITNLALVKCQIGNLGKATKFNDCIFYECYNYEQLNPNNIEIVFYNCQFNNCLMTLDGLVFSHCKIINPMSITNSVLDTCVLQIDDTYTSNLELINTTIFNS